MTLSYTPHADGAPARVIAYFKDNPDEELSTSDIATKFGVAQSGVQTSLKPAVAAGLLHRQMRRHMCYYSAGPSIVGAGLPDVSTADDETTGIVHAGAHLVTACHGASYAAGWWHDIETGEDLRGKRNVAELLCLIHSEISEAMEGHRKGLMDDKLPRRPMIEVELADAVIRICDLAGGLGLDLGGAIAEKLDYNARRADHKPEARRAFGGKAY